MDTIRVVINRRYGRFGLSREAFLRLRELGHAGALDETDIGEKWKGSDDVRTDAHGSFQYEIERDDPLLLQVIDELGAAVCSGPYAQLEIVTIPANIKWHIAEYDGMEQIDEEHRTWL